MCLAALERSDKKAWKPCQATANQGIKAEKVSCVAVSIGSREARIVRCRVFRQLREKEFVNWSVEQVNSAAGTGQTLGRPATLPMSGPSYPQRYFTTLCTIQQGAQMTPAS